MEKVNFESEEVREALRIFICPGCGQNEVINIDEKDKQFLINESIMPVKYIEDKHTLIFATTKDESEIRVDLRSSLQARTHKRIEFMFKVDSSLLSSFFTHYLGTTTGEEIIEVTSEESGVDINSSEIRRIQESILRDAATQHASDIHIEVTSSVARARIRVNGMLMQLFETSRENGIGVIRAFMNDARMHIENMYEPQSGRINRVMGGKTFDMRLQSVGLINGFQLVIRLLPAESKKLMTLTELGFEESQIKAFEQMIRKQEGIIIFTGPTGSGKTTSMYALLKLLDTPERKIITIEDPPEIIVSTINQIAINPTRNITWESALRSVMRQDPDIILIGEIRDSEVANIAMQAAITGHLVLTTLHVKEIESIPERFAQFATDTSVINKVTIADAIIGVISQRLVQKIYKPAAIRGPLPEWVREAFRERGVTLKEPVVLANKKATGDGYFQGFDMGPNGRTVIAEVLYADDNVKELIKNKGPRDLRAYLDSLDGHLSMAKHAALKIQREEIDPTKVAPLL
jgi:type IV pilus assembly protein PilB